MDSFEEQIKLLKEKQERENYILLQRRIERGDGKKSLGWQMKKENGKKIYESFDRDQLLKKKILLEQNKT